MDHKARIVVVGSANVDFIMGLTRLPAPGETVGNGKFQHAFGGKGANQAVAAARAGAEVEFISAVGNDHYALPMISDLVAEGIGTSGIYRDDENPSGCALILLDHLGQNLIAVSPGANSQVSIEHLEQHEALVANAEILVLQMEIPVQTCVRALSLGTKYGLKTILNYAPANDLTLPLTSEIDYLIVNEHEASLLAGMPVIELESAYQVAQCLRQMAPTTILITLGKEGVLVLNDETMGHIPGFSVNAVDTTAAGDVFAGVFATMVGEDRPLVEAIRFAQAGSAIAVTRAGAQPSIPRRKEIEQFLANR